MCRQQRNKSVNRYYSGRIIKRHSKQKNRFQIVGGFIMRIKKKLLSLLSALTLTASCVGCGKDENHAARRFDHLRHGR